jgi:hypothetical protein
LLSPDLRFLEFFCRPLEDFDPREFRNYTGVKYWRKILFRARENPKGLLPQPPPLEDKNLLFDF